MTGFGTDAAPTGGAADRASLRALTRARRVTRDLADDLLTHLPDVGDIGTQRELDTWVEQAADTLRALSEAIEERLVAVGRADRTDVSPTWVPRMDPVAGQTAARSAPSRHGRDRP